MGAKLTNAVEPHPIILYDGVCGLCDRLVQFVLKHDRRDKFRFAVLQSDFSAQLMARHGLPGNDLNTMYVVKYYGSEAESLVARSDAAIFVLRELGGVWNLLGNLMKIFPRPLRDFGYRLIASSRYRIFGKSDSCLLPQAGALHKFVDRSGFSLPG